MLFLKTCLYRFLSLEEPVSIMNSVEKMFANLAPKPFLPPVTFF
jgi:hypothetical protein